MSEEHRQAALRRYANETLEEKQERIRKAKGRNKGRKHTPEEIEKIKEARKKQHQVFDENARRNMSIAQKKYWRNLSKEERELKVKRFINAPREKTSDTKIELEVERQLKENGIQYEKQKYCYNKAAKRGFYIDFYLPKLDIMIECNGSYWHSLPHRAERDSELKYLVENSRKKIHKNLALIVLWDYEICSDREVVIKRIKGLREDI